MANEYGLLDYLKEFAEDYCVEIDNATIKSFAAKKGVEVLKNRRQASENFAVDTKDAVNQVLAIERGGND
jgi:hypothetical protein